MLSMMMQMMGGGGSGGGGYGGGGYGGGGKSWGKGEKKFKVDKSGGELGEFTGTIKRFGDQKYYSSALKCS